MSLQNSTTDLPVTVAAIASGDSKSLGDGLHVWNVAGVDICIEVIDGKCFVNGKAVLGSEPIQNFSNGNNQNLIRNPTLKETV